MTATISVSCPACNKKMKAPVKLKGKRIKCKGCGQSLTVAAEGAIAKKPSDDEWGPATAYSATTVDLAPRCPFCALEMESEAAVICLHCGYNLQTRRRMEARVLHPTTAGDYFLWLLPGIVGSLVALIFAGMIACVWLKIGMPEWLDEWVSIKIYITVACGFIAWGGGYFAVKRLIMNPHPPELVKTKDKDD